MHARTSRESETGGDEPGPVDLIHLEDANGDCCIVRVTGRFKPGVLTGHDVLRADVLAHASFVDARPGALSLPGCRAIRPCRARPRSRSSRRIGGTGTDATGPAGVGGQLDFPTDTPSVPSIGCWSGSSCGPRGYGLHCRREGRQRRHWYRAQGSGDRRDDERRQRPPGPVF
ncbi:DUF5959 family protein [Streptomyces sp. NPDC048558]|uniref:DUF5959 family protein n=1 Tax=Streptomyces sp. NPDC048558 TaxID=3155759 RepID=UPI00341AA7F4